MFGDLFESEYRHSPGRTQWMGGLVGLKKGYNTTPSKRLKHSGFGKFGEMFQKKGLFLQLHRHFGCLGLGFGRVKSGSCHCVKRFQYSPGDVALLKQSVVPQDPKDPKGKATSQAPFKSAFGLWRRLAARTNPSSFSLQLIFHVFFMIFLSMGIL